MIAQVKFVKKHNNAAKQCWMIEMDGIKKWAKVEAQNVYEFGVKTYKEGTVIEIDQDVKEDGLIYIKFAKLVQGGKKTAKKEVEAKKEQVKEAVDKATTKVTKSEVKPEPVTNISNQCTRKIVNSSNDGARIGCVLNNTMIGLKLFEGLFDINDLTLYKKIAKEIYVMCYDLTDTPIEQLRKEVNSGLREVK